MISFAIQSGSNGNSIYVEAGDTRLLFDAGVSGSCAERRMGEHHRDIRDVDAVLISHDHIDHVRGAGVFQRKFGLPVYMSRKTQAAITCDLGPMTNVRNFRVGEPLWFNGVTVHTLPTPHDAADGAVFVVEHDGRRLGILTDLGYPFTDLYQLLPTLDGCYLESNYDPEMLRKGPYPYHLQQRISGGRGHISNGQSAELVRTACRRLKWVALSHLSEDNNEPELALETHCRRVGREFAFTVASRYGVSEMMTL